MRLIVMRHAKSSWKAPAATDHERPLNGRGRGDAPRIGLRLAELGWTPDEVLSSDATRTRMTFELMAPGFAAVPGVRFLPALYHASTDDWREIAASLLTAPTALLLGHNPTLEQLVSELSGEDVEMRTACAALLASDEPSWLEALARPGRFRLVDFVSPHTLPD